MNGHQIAVWASVSAFFGSLLTLGAINILDPANDIRLAGSIVIAAFTAGGVYAKQRLDDAKAQRQPPK